MLKDETFTIGWNTLAHHVHQTAVDKGWWDTPEGVIALRAFIDDEPNKTLAADLMEVVDRLARRNDAEMLALIHSELSEALEGLRAGNPPDDKLPEFSSVEVELADVIIRMMDMAQQRDWDVAGAVMAKVAHNEGRAYKHGGKKF